MEGYYTDESHSEARYSWPWFCQAIDDRYFVLAWHCWTWQEGVSVYDIKEMREIPISNDTGYAGDYFRTCDNRIYMIAPGDEGGRYGPLTLQKAVVMPEMGESLVAIDLLKDYPGAERNEEYMDTCELSPDERYFVVPLDRDIVICDLQERKPAWRIQRPAWDSLGASEWYEPEALSFQYIAFRDAHTVYFYFADHRLDDNSNIAWLQVNRYALEITLP